MVRTLPKPDILTHGAEVPPEIRTNQMGGLEFSNICLMLSGQGPKELAMQGGRVELRVGDKRVWVRPVPYGSYNGTYRVIIDPSSSLPEEIAAISADSRELTITADASNLTLVFERPVLGYGSVVGGRPREQRAKKYPDEP